MDIQASLRSSKLLLTLIFAGMIIGGIVLLVAGMSENHSASNGSAVGWGCGFGTALYAVAQRIIALFERHLAAQRTPS